eukprot:6515643-Pyramimonas_sp.AAC.1
MAAAARERIRRQLLSARSKLDSSNANARSDSNGRSRHGEVRVSAVGGRGEEPLREHSSGTSSSLRDDVQGGDKSTHAWRVGGPQQQDENHTD